MSTPSGSPEHFSLSAGGLISLVQSWIRGPESRAFPVPIQILITVSLLWLPLVVLSLFEGSFIGANVDQPFIEDIVPHVRFLVAIPLLLLADRSIDPVAHAVVYRLENSDVVPVAEQSRFQLALASMRRARDSIWPDVTIIVLAFSITWLFKPGYSDSALETVSTSWLWAVKDGGVRYSTAGWWYLLISGPMFQVILFRWFWRFFIWAAFLFRVSNLSLVLRPSHPDLAGGLGYVGMAQQSFVAVFFAFATVASSTIAHDLLAGGGTLRDARLEILVLVCLLTAIIYGPLLFFSKQFFLARRAGLDEYGSLGYKLSEAFDHKWFGEGEKGDGMELLSSSDPSAIADYTAAYENVRAMRPVPATLRSVLMTAGVLLIPFLPLALTVFSLPDLIQRLVESLI